MKKNVLLFLGLFLVVSCQEKPGKTITEDSSEESTFQMYEMSEMASLMEQMYAHNTQHKERILSGEDLGSYPKLLINCTVQYLQKLRIVMLFSTIRLISSLRHKKPFMKMLSPKNSSTKWFSNVWSVMLKNVVVLYRASKNSSFRNAA